MQEAKPVIRVTEAQLTDLAYGTRTTMFATGDGRKSKTNPKTGKGNLVLIGVFTTAPGLGILQFRSTILYLTEAEGACAADSDF